MSYTEAATEVSMLPESCHCHVVPTAGRHTPPGAGDFDADDDKVADVVAVCVTAGETETVGVPAPFVGPADGVGAAVVRPPDSGVRVDRVAADAADDEPDEVPAEEVAAPTKGEVAAETLPETLAKAPLEEFADPTAAAVAEPSADDAARGPVAPGS